MSDTHPRPSRREREYAVLVNELHALDEDLAAARTHALEAVKGHLDLRHGHVHPPARGELVTLRDGAAIRIRPIEPGDREELREGLEHLSALSRYRQFRAPLKHLSISQVDFLTNVDHHDHEALVAFDATTGEGAGMAQYVRDRSDRGLAEVFFTAAEAWQGRGVASALLARLTELARARGIERIRAFVLVGNDRARHLIARVSDTVEESSDGGIIDIRATLSGAT